MAELLSTKCFLQLCHYLTTKFSPISSPSWYNIQQYWYLFLGQHVSPKRQNNSWYSNWLFPLLYFCFNYAWKMKCNFNWIVYNYVRVLQSNIIQTSIINFKNLNKNWSSSDNWTTLIPSIWYFAFWILLAYFTHFWYNKYFLHSSVKSQDEFPNLHLDLCNIF